MVEGGRERRLMERECPSTQDACGSRDLHQTHVILNGCFWERESGELVKFEGLPSQVQPTVHRQTDGRTDRQA